MRAIRSLAGFEKLHSSMAQVATESLQPHWQARRAPARRTSTLGFSAAVCAQASAAMRAMMAPKRKLLLYRCMFPGYADHFRAGVLHLDFARRETDEGAADE